MFRSLSCLWSLLAVANGIATISTKGSKFFTSDGDQWFVKGKHNHVLSIALMSETNALKVSRISLCPVIL
jgi:hypothetical protein